MKRPATPGRTGRTGRPSAHRRYLDAYTERSRAADLEERVTRAWPPRSVLELDGWRLRLGGGLPLPASSAWPRADGGRVPLDVRLAGTARFYRDAGVPPCIQIGPAAQPAGLDAALAERGWRREHVHELRTGALAGLTAPRPPAPLGGGEDGSAAAQATAVRAAAAQVHAETTDSGGVAERWLAAWAQRTGRDAAARATAATVLQRVPAASCWALAGPEQAPTGVARGVLDGGWLGIADLDADDALTAAALLARLLAWAEPGHAEQVWWLVPQQASGVRDLARRVGLRRTFTLHHRVLAPGTTGAASAGGA